jgi:GTPase SAR1 family protein
MTEPESEPIVLMWGASASGKSSLVAALFNELDTLSSINRARTGQERNAADFQNHWRDLREGRPGRPTGQKEVDILLHRNVGTAIRLRDIAGGRTDIADDPDLLRSAAVILFVMEFHAPDQIRQLHTIEGAWNISSDIPKALVFTKCELYLEYDHRAWQRQNKWWEEFPELNIYSRHIERFGDAVFPTSVYGYHHGSMLPAVTLGEFGEVRPFGIEPRGVVVPFAWALERIKA